MWPVLYLIKRTSQWGVTRTEHREWFCLRINKWVFFIYPAYVLRVEHTHQAGLPQLNALDGIHFRAY